ncbi:MAG: S8 family peptidase, partial [Dehalococcoidia bacterium]
MLFRLGCSAAAIAVALFMAAGVHQPRASAQSAGYASQRTGDIIVRFRAGASLTRMAGAIGRANAAVQDVSGASGLVLLHPAAGEPVDAAVARLRAEADVQFAEPNTTVRVATTTPTDPLYATYQWNLPQIGMPAAWDRTTGSPAVVVAVLDTGVDATHPDLAGRTVAGYNFIANNTNTADDNFHGTFVAGIIAASANNGTGIAGICWTCSIMPVKVLDAAGNGDMFHAAQGIDWAVAHGAKVINMSFGGSIADPGMQTSVNNAWNAGVVLVAAAGNDNGGPVLYPAAFPNVMAIASLTQAGARSSFSNIGPQLALSAPGENIASTDCTCAAYTGGYGLGSGTSFAAPQVTGVAALMVAAGTTSNATIVSTLESTATDVDAPGFDNNTGWGRINAAAALAPAYGVTWGANPLPSTMARGATAQTLVSFTNSGSRAWPSGGANPVRFSYHWKTGACPGASTSAFDGQRTDLPADVAPGASVTNLMTTVQAPSTAGTYCLVYDLVQEGITWFSWQGAAVQAATITVGSPGYGVSWGANTLPSTLAPGAS